MQIVHGKRRGVRRVEHVGSAHDERELEALRSAAAQRLASLYPQLDLELDLADANSDTADSDTAGGTAPAVAGVAAAGPGPLPIVSSRAAALWDGLTAAYDALGFEQATGRDAVFRLLVLARIIQPTSKQDSLRVLGEGRRRPGPVLRHPQTRPEAWAKEEFQHELAKA